MKIAQLDGTESRDAGIVVCLLHHLVPRAPFPAAACGARKAGPTSSAASSTAPPQSIEVGNVSSRHWREFTRVGCLLSLLLLLLLLLLSSSSSS